MKALRSRLSGAKGSERVEIGRFLVVELRNSSCGDVRGTEWLEWKRSLGPVGKVRYKEGVSIPLLCPCNPRWSVFNSQVPSLVGPAPDPVLILFCCCGCPEGNCTAAAGYRVRGGVAGGIVDGAQWESGVGDGSPSLLFLCQEKKMAVWKDWMTGERSGGNGMNGG